MEPKLPSARRKKKTRPGEKYRVFRTYYVLAIWRMLSGDFEPKLPAWRRAVVSGPTPPPLLSVRMYQEQPD